MSVAPEPVLHILSAGPLCTIQDGGRTGWLRFGVTPAGPMDWISHEEAGRAAGNPSGSAALEIGPGGLEFQLIGAAARFGLSCHGFSVTCNGKPVESFGAFTGMPGDIMAIRPGQRNLFAYVAVTGGFEMAPVMGSLSTHLRSGIGPLSGKSLSAGMEIPVADRGRLIDLPPVVFDHERREPAGLLRFVCGPQDDHFTQDSLMRLCTNPYKVSTRSDRMGFRLEGPALTHAKGHDIVSDGIAMGAIQVPGDGLPIVLMADRQPTGGYPKIGTVIRTDLPRLAQSRPGETVRFAVVSIDEAVLALRAMRRYLDDL